MPKILQRGMNFLVMHPIFIAPLVAVVIVGLAMLVGKAIHHGKNSDCIEMCEAAGSSMRVQNYYGCMCRDGSYFNEAH